MLDIDKDVEVEIYFRSVGRAKAYASLLIGGFIKINGFEITQAKDGKIYVINPHTIKNIYNKVEFKREINYVATAELLPHNDRKKIINKIIEKFGIELDELKKKTDGMIAKNKTYNSKTVHEFDIREIE